MDRASVTKNRLLMRPVLITLLLTTSLALVACGGSSHHSTRASSPSAAARTFFNGWLLYEYGHAKAAVIKDATPTFTTVLADYPPDIPPTPASRHLYAHVVSLALLRRGSNWLARAHITDGQRDTFDETAQLIQTGRRWLVDLIIPQP
jgi:hypothetical protein